MNNYGSDPGPGQILGTLALVLAIIALAKTFL
jgi:hypothetical protein